MRKLVVAAFAGVVGLCLAGTAQATPISPGAMSGAKVEAGQPLVEKVHRRYRSVRVVRRHYPYYYSHRPVRRYYTHRYYRPRIVIGPSYYRPYRYAYRPYRPYRYAYGYVRPYYSGFSIHIGRGWGRHW